MLRSEAECIRAGRGAHKGVSPACAPRPRASPIDEGPNERLMNVARVRSSSRSRIPSKQHNCRGKPIVDALFCPKPGDLLPAFAPQACPEWPLTRPCRRARRRGWPSGRRLPYQAGQAGQAHPPPISLMRSGGRHKSTPATNKIVKCGHLSATLRQGSVRPGVHDPPRAGQAPQARAGSPIPLASARSVSRRDFFFLLQVSYPAVLEQQDAITSTKSHHLLLASLL